MSVTKSGIEIFVFTGLAQEIQGASETCPYAIAGMGRQINRLSFQTHCWQLARAWK